MNNDHYLRHLTLQPTHAYLKHGFQAEKPGGRRQTTDACMADWRRLVSASRLRPAAGIATMPT
jgi:hypothetical protein